MKYIFILAIPLVLASCTYQVTTTKVGSVTENCDMYMSSNDFNHVYTTVCKDGSTAETQYKEGKHSTNVKTVTE